MCAFCDVTDLRIATLQDMVVEAPDDSQGTVQRLVKRIAELRTYKAQTHPMPMRRSPRSERGAKREAEIGANSRREEHEAADRTDCHAAFYNRIRSERSAETREKATRAGQASSANGMQAGRRRQRHQDLGGRMRWYARTGKCPTSNSS
jgi:hypothetical protein